MSWILENGVPDTDVLENGVPDTDVLENGVPDNIMLSIHFCETNYSQCNAHINKSELSLFLSIEGIPTYSIQVPVPHHTCICASSMPNLESSINCIKRNYTVQ